MPLLHSIQLAMLVAGVSNVMLTFALIFPDGRGASFVWRLSFLHADLFDQQSPHGFDAIAQMRGIPSTRFHPNWEITVLNVSDRFGQLSRPWPYSLTALALCRRY